MSEQRTLASAVHDSQRKTIRRAQFLQDMDALTPWATRDALVRPHYAVAGNGRRSGCCSSPIAAR